MVATSTPSAFPIVVAIRVSTTLRHDAAIAPTSPISVRWKTIPIPASAGCSVIDTLRPECRPIPVQPIDDFRVF
jgi:hypothetical protein